MPFPKLLSLHLPKTFVLRVAILLIGSVSSIQAQQSETPKTATPRTLGILLFPGFELLDAYGPLEMWGNLKGQVRVVTVARQRGEVASIQGPKTVAEYGLGDCPKLDLLLVPGGFGVQQALAEKELLDWLRARAATAEITMSVCNGASLLAAAGLLDGRPATTNKAFWEMATTPGPKVNWVRKARWVDDGNVVTSSGVSAGIDMTLHVIARLFGQAKAERLAAQTEYEWHRDPSWDPFADLHSSGRKKRP